MKLLLGLRLGGVVAVVAVVAVVEGVVEVEVEVEVGDDSFETLQLQVILLILFAGLRLEHVELGFNPSTPSTR